MHAHTLIKGGGGGLEFYDKFQKGVFQAILIKRQGWAEAGDKWNF